jgi:hypothetical protein
MMSEKKKDNTDRPRIQAERKESFACVGCDSLVCPTRKSPYMKTPFCRDIRGLIETLYGPLW